MKKRSILSVFLSVLIIAVSLFCTTASADVVYTGTDSYTFETFEDLKELASMDYYYLTEAQYVGSGPLVISEDLEIPPGLCINAQYSAVIIDEGVTLDIRSEYSSLDAYRLMVNGTLHSSFLYVTNRLVLNGDIYNHDFMYFDSKQYTPTIIEGNGTIHKAGAITEAYYIHYAESFEKVKEYIEKANADSEGIFVYDIYTLEFDLVIDESITIPENANLITDYMGTPRTVVIKEGCMVTLDNSQWYSSIPITVEGVLDNSNGSLYLYYDSYAELNVAENGYLLDSTTYIYSDYLENPFDAVKGVNEDNYIYYSSSDSTGRVVVLTHTCQHHLGSESDFTRQEVKPTCADRGYTYYECRYCAENFKLNFTEPTGIHTYSNDKDNSCNICGFIREIKEEPAKPTVKSVPMYRMYNPNSGEHFYTGSTEERSILVNAGWKYEGVAFNFPVVGKPVYRLYEPKTGEHLYTMDEAEKAKLLSEGWNYEGVAFNSAGEDEVAQYRLHNPNATCGAYHFTGSKEERDILIAAGWEYQGIGWYSCIR